MESLGFLFVFFLEKAAESSTGGVVGDSKARLLEFGITDKSSGLIAGLPEGSLLFCSHKIGVDVGVGGEGRNVYVRGMTDAKHDLSYSSAL